MSKRYRRTILDEYLHLSACGSEKSFAGDVREEIGEFVAEYIKNHGKAPSSSRIAMEVIPNEEFSNLDILKEVYTKVSNEEITFDEYENVVNELYYNI